MPNDYNDNKRKLTLVGVTALSLIGSGILYGCGSEHGENGEAGHPNSNVAGESGEAGAQPSGIGGGESGESGDPSADLVHDDAAYLALLATVQGHLAVSQHVYGEGDKEGAAHHAAHPGHEILPKLLPAMKSRKAPAIDIEAYQDAVKQNGDISAAYQKVSQEITLAENAIQPSDKTKAEAITKLARQAAGEYNVGVDGDKIVNREEYQDAFGFISSARELALSFKDNANKAAQQQLLEQLTAIEAAWKKGQLANIETTPISDGKFSALVARIEIAAQKIR